MLYGYKESQKTVPRNRQNDVAVCLRTYGTGVLRSRVWNQDLGSARATVISLVELMFPLSVF